MLKKIRFELGYYIIGILFWIMYPITTWLLWSNVAHEIVEYKKSKKRFALWIISLVAWAVSIALLFYVGCKNGLVSIKK